MRSISSHNHSFLSTESRVEIKAVFKDELVFVAYRSLHISYGLSCVYINSWPCVYSVVTCSGPSATYLLHKLGSVCSHSFIALACAECDVSLPFSRASSIFLSNALLPAKLLDQLFFHPLSPHLAICFLVYLSVLFPNSCIIPFWEFCFLAFSVHSQCSIIYLTLFSLSY